MSHSQIPHRACCANPILCVALLSLLAILFGATPAAAQTWQKITIQTSSSSSSGTNGYSSGPTSYTVPASLSVSGVNSYNVNGTCTALAVTNTGSATISGLFSSQTAGTTSAFQLCAYGTSPCGTSLAAGASCNFGVQLLGTATLGSNTETVTVGGTGIGFSNVSVLGVVAWPACGTTIGNVCPDGTIYAGLSPDSGTAMYTTPCDLGMTGTQNSCSGSQLTYEWGTYGKTTGYTSATTGKANTAGLIANYGTYNDSYVTGVPAAQACASLTTAGRSWYLPSVNELTVLYNNHSAIGGFQSGSYYWSSSEYNVNYAYYEVVTSGSTNYTSKNNTNPVRCVWR